MIAVFQLVGPKAPLRLVTDGHESYPRALARIGRGIKHEVHPNPVRGPKGAPRSLEAKQRDAAMFSSDLLHMILRHSIAHHRRETIAFGRRLNALMERLYLAAIWRNFVKGVSERRQGAETPAIILGLTTERWSWARVLARRLFPDRLPVPRSWMQIYRREWITPGGINARHDLARAF